MTTHFFQFEKNGKIEEQFTIVSDLNMQRKGK